MQAQHGTGGLFGRVAPPMTLLLLAPLVAEYLLGDLRVTDLAAFPALAFVCGGGAVLIREVVLRNGGRWMTFLALAVAYAVLEEGILDQSFFNPDFMHQHLLAYGFWPRLGTSPAWVICVTTLHVVWSLAVPIGMAESLFAERSKERWLGRVGLAMNTLLFLLGILALGSFSYRTATHHASARQIAVCSVIILGLIAIPAISRRTHPSIATAHRRDRPVSIGLVSFLAGSLFVELYWIGPSLLRWPGNATAVAELGLGVLALFLLRGLGSKPWTILEVWSASTGGLLVYVWHGYRIDRALHPAAGVLDHTWIVLGLCAIQTAAWFRVAHFRPDTSGETANQI
jgi:hypothetical protein